MFLLLLEQFLYTQKPRAAMERFLCKEALRMEIDMIWSKGFSIRRLLPRRISGSRFVVLCCLLTVLLPSHSWSEQTIPNLVIVDQYPTEPPSSGAQPISTVPTTSNDIKGIRIEPNGALITGPLNARKVYIKLDAVDLPRTFQSIWVGDQALCSLASEASKSNAEEMPDGSIFLTERQFFGRQKYDIQAVFVPIPDTFTLDLLNSGKQLVLPGADYRMASEALIIFSSRGHRDYLILSLIAQGQKLNVRGQNGTETAVRCN
ncbi:hypothetical protein [uncultured Agrobacterium sp.]|uniref:hypothetical protein n=1 Tax=uncultured Agrobacterium sp. TaxID=157277 RepID=UPI0025FBA498|nr:hypothetical protein [uncultured Agrobacterium sp.]